MQENTRPTVLDSTLKSHFLILYRRQRLPGKTASTDRKYLAAIRHLSNSLGKIAEISDLTDDNLRDCMDYVSRVKQRSVPTVNDVRKKLVALWNFLARKAIVPTYPEVSRWIEPEKVPIAWMPDELARLWAACRLQDGWIASVPAAEWWLGLHSLLYDTGERIGAVMQLEWRDVSLHSRDCVFRAETRKGKRKPNQCRLHADTIAIIGDWPQYGNRRVFAWHLSKESLWHRYEKLLADAKLPFDRWHKFHAMRKTHASFGKAAGMDPSELLGHTDRRVTAAYLDPRIAGRAQASDVLRRPTDPEPPRAA